MTVSVFGQTKENSLTLVLGCDTNNPNRMENKLHAIIPRCLLFYSTPLWPAVILFVLEIRFELQSSPSDCVYFFTYCVYLWHMRFRTIKAQKHML